MQRITHSRIDNIPQDNVESLRSIYELALEKSYQTSVDEKSKNGSWVRVRSNKTASEALDICLATKTHWTIIYKDMRFVNEPCYWDFGACTLGLDSDVFIWTRLKEDDAKIIFEKYNLNVDNYA